MLSTALALLALQQPAINLETTAVSAKRLMQMLTEATKEKHTVAEGLAQEILVVRVKNASPDDIRDRIAHACHGSWKAEADGTHVLWRRPLYQQEIEQAEIELRAREIADEIAELKKELAPDYSPESVKTLAMKLNAQYQGKYPPPAYYGRGALKHQTPSMRALVKLVAAMDAKELVMNQGERRVFSNRPTRMQMKLPTNAYQITKELFEEQKVWADAVAAMPVASADMNYSENPFLQKEAFKEVPLRLMLIAVHTNNMSPVTLRLDILDANNTIIGTASLWLTSDQVRTATKTFEEGPPKDGTKLKLSKRAMDFEKLITGYLKTGKSDPALLTPEHRTRYLNPQENDPLGYGVSEGLMQIAAESNRNLVANLPDFAFLTAGYTIDVDAMTTQTLLKRLVSLAAMDMQEPDGWLLLRPTLPIEAAYMREHREMMGEYLRFRDEHGYVSAALAGKRAFANPTQPYLAQIISMIVTPKGAIANDYDWQLLRFYGSLTDNQREILSKGARLGIGNLSKEAAFELRRLAYQNTMFSWRAPRGVEVEFGQFGNLTMEPTEAMPDGPPSGLTITGKVTAEPILMAVYDENMPAFSSQRVFPIATIAYLTVAKEKDPNGEHGTLPTKFKIGSQNTISLNIQFTPSLSKDAGIQEIRVDEDKTYTLKSLPDDIKKKIDAQIELYRKQEWRPGGVKPPTPK